MNKKTYAILAGVAIVLVAGAALIAQGQFLQGAIFKLPLSRVAVSSRVPVSGVKPLSVAAATWNISRGQLAELLVNTIAPNAKMDQKRFDKCNFSDVTSYDSAKNAIIYLCQKGALVGMADGKYYPARTVTNAEAAKTIYNVFLANGSAISPATPTFVDVPKTAWFYTHVETLQTYNVFGQLVKNFYPENLLKVRTAKSWVQAAANNIDKAYWLK